MACSEERLQRRLCRWWVRQDCGAWDNRLERHFDVGRSNWPITEKGQRGVMAGVVVVVVVLFSLVVFQGNIAWLGRITGILGDVGPSSHSHRTPWSPWYMA
jgi:hypothetical protein